MNDRQIKEAFEEVKVDDAFKQKTINTILKKTSVKKPFPMRMVLTAAVLLFTMIGGIFSYTIPVYAISLDDTTSVELQVNLYNKVVSVSTYDSSSVPASVTNMDYTEAVTAILESESFSNNTVITVAGNNQAGCQKMIENLQNCKGSMCMSNASYNTADSTMIAQAKEYGMSLGKYKMYLMLKEMDPTFTIEQAQTMTMQEIHQRMNKGMGKVMK
jgi:hypothetical protein